MRRFAAGARCLPDRFADEDAMPEIPDDNIDHYALGYYAPGKGLSRDACPYAHGTAACAQWLAGYDAAQSGTAPEPSPPHVLREGPPDAPGKA
ncbi:Rmf/CrpP family protein [Methylobacterium nodulans]|uniref:Ribosome modulation factor n=1 Tax=Methylobacterium nodulans (strain LMG 21967 / CNCM I-2342 / ORS 2060) TaxID=460265 RepID=B8IG40_METNO|nr:Rmf/CrpP family protein [Methylobacterium nodulans]ACL61517.1 hypothetical protein Mnod_6759 [Methylobacterium nodulans ORS 2060]